MRDLTVISLLIGLLTTLQERAFANTIESPGQTVGLLTVASVGVSVVNIGFLVFPPHGSKAAGIVGAATGTALIVATHFDDTLEVLDESGVYYGVGIACAALGLVDYFAANNGPDHGIYGMRLDPSLRSFDNQRWVGMQLTASW